MTDDPLGNMRREIERESMIHPPLRQLFLSRHGGGPWIVTDEHGVVVGTLDLVRQANLNPAKPSGWPGDESDLR